MFSRKISNLILSFLIAGGFLLSSLQVNSEDLGDVDSPIKLAINEWTGQHISTHIAGQLLEKLGYSVEYVNAGNYPQFQALADGDIHATMEGWTNNLGDIYPVKKAEGTIVDIGPLGLDAGEGWVYLKFMEDMCPGLPAWEAMNDCAENLVTPETLPMGRFLAYPADWGNRSEMIIAALELNYKAVPGGTEGAMVAEIKAADAAQKPIFMMFWQPHYVFAEIGEVAWVDLPAYEEGCDTDPAWGMNPDATHDCGVFKPETMKIAWSGFQERWPAAWDLLSSYQLDNASQEAMMYEIDVEGADIVEVTGQWLEDNEDRWSSWVSSAMGS